MAGRNVLLVEGADDEHVIKHLCAHHGVPHLDEIANSGGVPQLIESFPVRLKESDVEALGVVVDADTNLQARWEALRDRLREARYDPVPQTPLEGGTILPSPAGTLLPRVGIWLMPDNRTSGIPEDFLRFLVPVDSPLLTHVEHSVDGIPPAERRFSDQDRPKAVIHTWLAWQEHPGKPLGTAITVRYLDAGVQEAGAFIDWLRRLFYP